MARSEMSCRREIILEMIPGDEHELQISSDISKQSDIMYPAFREALISVKRIIDSSEKYFRDTENNDRLYGYSNNIIAFCGKRGQGKTSAMISFARALEQHKQAELDELVNTNASKFYVLAPIDPAMLENSSALDVILSRLYQAAEDEWIKPSMRYSTSISSEADKREIVQLFQHCLSGARALRNKDRKDDDFDNLAYLVDGLQMKVKLHELVQRFLMLLNMRPDSGYLVIQLDDTDLQLGNAYDVLDEICKYLSLPNVIVLMATDMEQLQALVGQHYLNELELSVRHDMLEDEKIHQMAANYLNKLIPASQTIYLPSLKLSMQTSETIKIKRIGDKGEETEDIQDHFLSQIFNKTGIAFARQNGYLHNILPSTLRGIRHLFRLLDDMEDCGDQPTIPRYARTEDGYDGQQAILSDIQRAGRERDKYLKWLEKRERNLARFESYLLNEWGEGRLTKKNMDTIRKILESSSPRMFERAAVAVSDQQLPKRVYYYNKLVKLIRSAEETAFESADELFVFTVKLLMTVWLHKTAIRCQKNSLEQWDVTKSFVFKMEPLKQRFYGGIFPGLCPSRPQVFQLSRDEAKTENTLFGTVEDGVFKPDAFKFFENALVYDPTGEDPEEHKRIDYIQRYSLFVCCNLEVQEMIRQYVHTEKTFVPNISKVHPRQFMADVIALFRRISDMLAKEYGYLAPKMPFAYEGTILDALPLGVQAILRPLTPEIGELSEGIIEFLLDKTEQMQALVTISNIITSDAAEALNFLYHNMASVDIEDEDIIHDVWIIGNLIKQFQDNPDLPIKDADEKRIELLLTLDNLEEVLRKMQTK